MRWARHVELIFKKKKIILFFFCWLNISNNHCFKIDISSFFFHSLFYIWNRKFRNACRRTKKKKLYKSHKIRLDGEKKK